MDQPKTQRGRQTRGAIVWAAAELMYERGVRGTSLDDVLSAAHAGKSQLYHYFDTKEDLVGAVLEHQLARVLSQQAEFPLETWSGLRAWFEALLEGQRMRTYRGCPVGSMAAEMSVMSTDMRARVKAAFDRWQRTLRDSFARMQTRGRLAAEVEPEALAAVTLAQIQGGYLLSTASQSLEPMRQALDAAYATLRSYAS